MSESRQDTKGLPGLFVKNTEDIRQRDDPDRTVDDEEAKEYANDSSVSMPAEENVDLGPAVGTEYARTKHQADEGDLAQVEQEKSVGQTGAKSSSHVIAEIRALQQRVLDLEKQVMQEPRSSKLHRSRPETNSSKREDDWVKGKDKNLRKLKRKAPHGRRWVKEVEARAEDTSDTDKWSTNSSTMSRDFNYYRKRLRENHHRELNRLNAQMRRYRTRKEKKQARQLADEAEVEGKEIERNLEQIRSQEPSIQRPDTKRNRPIENHGAPRLNFAGWHTFKATRSTQSGTSFAIDVLIGEPTISDSMISDVEGKTMTIKANESSATRWTASGQETKRPDHFRWDGQGPLPERIRINSKPIIDILSKVHGKELFAQKQFGSSVVMLRPFRMLNFYAKNIRELCARLAVDISREPSSSILDDALQATDHVKAFSTGDLKRASTVDMDNSPSVEVPTLDHTEEASSLEHLKCLLEFIDNYISKKIEYLNSTRCEKIVFSDIWYLFTPGTLVISSDGKQAYRVASLRSKGHKGTDAWDPYMKSRGDTDDDRNDIIIKCVFVHYDGRHLGPVIQTFSIDKFDGEKDVVSLDIYPLRFYILMNINEWTLKATGDRFVRSQEKLETGTKELQDRLIRRGRRFVSAAAVKHMHYTGLNLDTRVEIESKVMIDFEEAYSSENDSAESRKEWRPDISRLIGTELYPEFEEVGRGCDAQCCWEENIHDDSYVETNTNLAFINNMMAELKDTPDKLPSVTIFPRLLDEAKTGVNKLTDDELVIMSHSAPGFILRDRSWANLEVDNLVEIADRSEEEIETIDDDLEEDSEGAFGQLVLPPGHKMMLLSLISQHYRNKAENRDEQIGIARGKGQGLIILLHGAPGVGKTTTAECVAEVFKQPLFQITSDLGSNPREVDTALNTNFALANKWGCILLFDEADVFLAGRKPEDFNRNGMVVVFLRALEYYPGTLFLTTNRIGDFDEAFASRIHLSLNYPAFDEASSVKVCKLNLKLMKDRLRDRIRIEEDEIIAAVREHWRGQKLTRLGWNGRQIRNACQMALALAEFEAQPKGQKYNIKEKSATKIYLRQEHFKVVFNAHLDFTEDVRPLVRGRGIL